MKITSTSSHTPAQLHIQRFTICRDGRRIHRVVNLPEDVRAAAEAAYLTGDAGGVATAQEIILRHIRPCRACKKAPREIAGSSFALGGTTCPCGKVLIHAYFTFTVNSSLTFAYVKK